MRAEFRSLIGDLYDVHKLIFSDDSKSQEGVGSAVGSQQRNCVIDAGVNSLYIWGDSSATGRKIVNKSLADGKYLVFSDSFSVCGVREAWPLNGG